MRAFNSCEAIVAEIRHDRYHHPHPRVQRKSLISRVLDTGALVQFDLPLPSPCRLAYNLANFLRQLVLPKPIQGWTLTTLREKLVKIGSKVVTHSRYLIFQLAEVAVPRPLFAALVERIGRLRLPNASR
jgi:hypothetical protein